MAITPNLLNHSVVLVGGVVATHVFTLIGEEVK